MTERTKGLLITFVGVMAIIPDALLVRLVVADEWTTLFWRGVLTAISITVALVITHRRQTFLRFAQIGALGVWLAALFAGGAICFVVAITLTKVANVLFIVATTPLYAAIIARVFLGERVPLRIWIAIGFAMVGVAVIASASATRGADSVLGDALAFLAALSMAVTLSLARKARSHSMVPAMALAGVLYALAILPCASPLDVSAADVCWLALMGLVFVPLGFSMLTIAPRYLPTPEVSLLLLLEAVLGPLLVWWVVGESPGSRGLIGGGIVVATLLVLNVVALRTSGAHR
jgi:drug/metabolite transporter (DMT)-like permease